MDLIGELSGHLAVFVACLPVWFAAHPWAGVGALILLSALIGTLLRGLRDDHRR